MPTPITQLRRRSARRKVRFLEISAGAVLGGIGEKHYLVPLKTDVEAGGASGNRVRQKQG